MSVIIRSYLLNVAFVILFGWGIVELYRSNVQFSQILRSPEPPWELSMNVGPILLLLLLSAIVIYASKQQKKIRVSFWLFPLIFPEADERERMITAKACRTTFISIWTVVPLCACLLPFYPLVEMKLPEYPIYLLLFVLLVQVTAFHFSLYRSRL